MKIGTLHERVVAVAPIDGLDSNGVIHFKAEATAEQHAAAEQIVAAHLVEIGIETADDLADAIRAARNTRLAACDWTVLPDAPLDAAAQAAWLAYRQALRDLTSQATFPEAVEWPVQP
ncbi:MAG: tail fiber assembly protein [Pseudomonadota bacterium]